jgi:hypothetical protein
MLESLATGNQSRLTNVAVGWFLCLKRRDVLIRLRRSALPLRLHDVVAPYLIGGDAWIVGKLESLRVLSGIAPQQIVGRERRERVSQLE